MEPANAALKAICPITQSQRNLAQSCMPVKRSTSSSDEEPSEAGGVFRLNSTYHDYPIVRCPPALETALRRRATGTRVLLAFECFLQVTGSRFFAKWDPLSPLKGLVPEFIGALHASHFLQCTHLLRYYYTRMFLAAVRDAYPGTPWLDELKPSPVVATPSIAMLATAFEEKSLLHSAVEIWRGWPVVSSSGETLWLPLLPMYKTMGATWTREFYSVVATRVAGARSPRIEGLNQFITFLASRKGVSPALLQDKGYVGEFWRDFWTYYSSERSRTSKTRVFAVQWASQWVPFARNVLSRSRLIAQSPIGFAGPTATPKNVVRVNVNAADPDLSLGLLLAEVPRLVSDKTALEFLLRSVPRSISLVERWAEVEVKDLYQRMRRRKRLANLGCKREPLPRGFSPPNDERWKVSRENPEHLANACATYKAYGYETASEETLRLRYPKPLTQTAFELGLPTAGALTPHAALLVIHHPEITPSFLESLELYDKDGKLIGVRRLDGGTYLMGYKYRKGAKRAPQRVKLNHVTVRVVWCVLSATQDLRRYLRERGDDAWRYGFLTCGKAFGYPNRERNFSAQTGMPRREASISSRMAGTCNISLADARQLVRRLSLRSLRATVAIQVFMKTHSEYEMANALGHEEFNPQLLARYLPEPVLAFFRARWVSAFQTSVIAVVTRDTPYQLKATGFETLSELNEFMRNNALPGLEDALLGQSSGTIGSSTGRVLFNANECTLSYLICASEVSSAIPDTCDAEVAYWGEFGKYMLPHIKSRSGLDPTLDACMAAALALDKSALLEAMQDA